MNKRICTAAAVLALTMCTVHAEAVYNLDEVIVEADMDKARDAFGDIVTEQSYARTGGDVEVITRKEIEEKHFRILPMQSDVYRGFTSMIWDITGESMMAGRIANR